MTDENLGPKPGIKKAKHKIYTFSANMNLLRKRSTQNSPPENKKTQEFICVELKVSVNFYVRFVI
jgi:hypothetical protein